MFIYLIGAGASAGEDSSYKNYRFTNDLYKSVIPPINHILVRLKYINDGFDDFFDERIIERPEENPSIYIETKDSLKRELAWMYNLLSFEPFADILAETLYSINEADFEKFTKIWSFYLIIEQCFNGVDLRYKTFFTNLYSSMPDNHKLPNNVTIFSWNNDYQIEEALFEKRFCNSKSLYDSVIGENIYLRNRFIKDNNQKISRPHFRLFKLNGSAPTFTKKDETLYDLTHDLILSSNINNHEKEYVNYSSKYHSLNEYLSIGRKKCMINKILFYYNDVNKFHCKPSIKFAWDNSRENLITQIDKINSIDNAEAIIAIGYSFPLLNARIDKKIIDKCNPKNIYIQCLEGDKNAIEIKLKGLWNGTPEFITGKNPSDIKEFFIPYNLLAENYTIK